jgi:hypothetical protein
VIKVVEGKEDKLMLTNEQKEKILHDSARKSGLDGHITIRGKQSELDTNAEQMMGRMSNPRNPHKNSYLYCDSVDACFYIDHDMPFVTFTARWNFGSKDLENTKYTATFIILNDMLSKMQEAITELIT